MIEDIARSWNWVDAPPLSPTEEQVLGEVFWRLLSGKAAVPAGVAEALGLSPDTVDGALVTLEAQRCLRRSTGDGAIVAARGLMMQPSRHHLVTDMGTMFTQCAVDAIAIPAALEIAGRVDDSCPVCERRITITVEQHQKLAITPSTAIVVMARAERAVDCCDDAGIPTMCNETNLFCCPDHAARWQGKTATLENAIVTPSEALEVGPPLWERFARRKNAAKAESQVD